MLYFMQCFKDLEEDIICGPDILLKIDKDKELGRGGHALVLRGELLNANKVGLFIFNFFTYYL